MGKYTAEQKLQLLNNLDLESMYVLMTIFALQFTIIQQLTTVYNGSRHGCWTTS